MEAERFNRLMMEARKFAHVKPDILNLAVPDARRKLNATVDVLEAECTPDQWVKVLEAIEQGWP